MLRERRTAAEAVATSLFATEDETDKVMASCAELARRMSNARLDIKVSALFGQDAFAHVSQAYAALTEARRHIGEAHRELDKVSKGIGLGAVSYGPLPKPDEITAGQPQVRVVPGEALTG